MGHGHTFEDCLSYTPRQMAALLFFANRAERRRRLQDLSLHTVALHGDKQKLKDVQKDLEKEF
jgi:hypothetical protein